MDLSRYNERTRKLVREVEASAGLKPDAYALRKLNQLRKTGNDLNDDELLGFVCYHSAYIKYYLYEGYGVYQKDLSAAVRHLLRCGNRVLLAHAYNFIAVDAHHGGNYGIAYNYYMRALWLESREAPSITSGMIHINLSVIFAELGDYRRARKHIKNGIRIILKHPDDTMFPVHCFSAYINDGIYALELNNMEAAQRALQKADHHSAKVPRTIVLDHWALLDILRARIAFAEGDEKTAHALVSEMTRRLSDHSRHPGDIMDITKFCRFLIARGEVRAAGQMIEHISARVMASGIGHQMRTVSELKVEYYTACNQKKHLWESLREQKQIVQAQRDDLNRMYKYSTDIVRFDNLIRREQSRIREEHERLERQVVTDALTGIPNRYALNIALEEAFERSYEGKRLLGVEIMDIDCFKEYNDTYGHHEGDRCIASIAALLNRLQRENFPGEARVQCFRYGGDEFVLLYEGLTKEQIRSIARLIAKSIATLHIPHRKSRVFQEVTVSQGICVAVPARKNKVWDFLSAADTAMYTVKRLSVSSGQKSAGVLIRNLSKAYSRETR